MPNSVRPTLLVLELQSQKYGIPTEHVREVVRAVAVSGLTGASSVVEGVIDYRGVVVPVLNLRRRFRHEPRGPTLGDRFVIATVGDRTVALRVDETVGIEELEEGALTGAEEVWAAGTRIAGVLRTAEGLVAVADPDAFLSQAEADALDAALAIDEEQPM